MNYIWQQSTNQVDWTDVVETGGTTNAFQTTPLTLLHWYRATISYEASGCGSLMSEEVQVIVYPFPDVSLETLNPSCQLNSGEITFYFEEIENRPAIEFSLDGGQNYYPPVMTDMKV